MEDEGYVMNAGRVRPSRVPLGKRDLPKVPLGKRDLLGSPAGHVKSETDVPPPVSTPTDGSISQIMGGE